MLWNNHLVRVALCLIILACATTSDAQEADSPPGGIRLLPDYTHKTLQGFDSRPGLISKKDGLQIRYDIGRVRKAGLIGLGGDFSDQTKSVPAKDRHWYKEQLISGKRVHLAYTKKGVLRASYPESGINFNVEAKTHEELAEALLIILSYPTPAKSK